MRRLLTWASLTTLLIFGLTVFAQKPSAPAASAAKDDPDFARLVKDGPPARSSPALSSTTCRNWPVYRRLTIPGLSHRRAEKAHLRTPILTNTSGARRRIAARQDHELGQTDEGRECVVVFVGSEESIRNLETERGYLANLPIRARFPSRRLATSSPKRSPCTMSRRPPQRRNRSA